MREILGRSTRGLVRPKVRESLSLGVGVDHGRGVGPDRGGMALDAHERTGGPDPSTSGRGRQARRHALPTGATRATRGRCTSTCRSTRLVHMWTGLTTTTT